MRSSFRRLHAAIPLLALLASAVVAPSKASDADASHPPAVWTDKSNYAWLSPDKDVRPFICLNILNVDPETSLFLPTTAPYSVHDELGHQTFAPMSFEAVVEVSPGATWRTCMRLASQEGASEALQHEDIRWTALTQASLAPPGLYEIRVRYVTADNALAIVETPLILTEVDTA